MSGVISLVISLTPGFSPVMADEGDQNRFNGFSRAGKPLKRLGRPNAFVTRLKPLVSTQVTNPHDFADASPSPPDEGRRSSGSDYGGRGGAFIGLPLSPALSPLVPRGERGNLCRYQWLKPGVNESNFLLLIFTILNKLKP